MTLSNKILYDEDLKYLHQYFLNLNVVAIKKIPARSYNKALSKLWSDIPETFLQRDRLFSYFKLKVTRFYDYDEIKKYMQEFNNSVTQINLQYYFITNGYIWTKFQFTDLNIQYLSLQFIDEHFQDFNWLIK